MKEFLLEHFFEHAMWIVVTYMLVLVAMAVDLITGVRKSRKLKQKINSRGYKRTCRKAMDYFMPLMCLSCIDILAATVIGLPVLTMVYGGYCVFCELTSVTETIYDKKAIRKDFKDIVELGEELCAVKEMIKKLIK